MMIKSLTPIACSILIVSLLCIAQPAGADSVQLPTLTRGWNYIVEKLIKDGEDLRKVVSIYEDSRMPHMGRVFFALNPQESARMYAPFMRADRINMGKKFLSEHDRIFTTVEREYNVSRYVIAAILLIETQYGRITGNDMVLNRLSRVASVADRDNLLANYERHKRDDPAVRFEQVVARAQYLEETFYPEVQALFEMARRDNSVNLFELKGSRAGAFGIPQFLPTSYLRFGVDGSKSGMVSLFSEVDSIWSTANYLSNFGWHDEAPLAEKRQAIWAYNRSDAYVNAVLDVAGVLEKGN